MIPCMIFGNIINNVNTDDYKMVAILFFSPIITHLIAFTLGQIGRTILGFKSEEEDYLLVVAGSTFGNHGTPPPLFSLISNIHFSLLLPFSFFLFSFFLLFS